MNGTKICLDCGEIVVAGTVCCPACHGTYFGDNSNEPIQLDAEQLSINFEAQKDGKDD